MAPIESLSIAQTRLRGSLKRDALSVARFSEKPQQNLRKLDQLKILNLPDCGGRKMVAKATYFAHLRVPISGPKPRSQLRKASSLLMEGEMRRVGGIQAQKGFIVWLARSPISSI